MSDPEPEHPPSPVDSKADLDPPSVIPEHHHTDACRHGSHMPTPTDDGSGHVHGPGCNHHHEPPIPPATPEAVAPDGHVHGAGCNHDHHTPSSSSGGSGHVHGPGCGHDHAPSASSGGGVHYHGDTPCSHSHGPSGGVHEPHLPKGKSNAGWWVAGIVAAAGMGAYLINEYGKPKKKEIAPKSGDWKERAQQPTNSEARSL